MKRTALFFLFFSIFIIVAACIYTASAALSADDIYNGVLRLHVIANSDSNEDQELKLKVRDGIIDIFSSIGSRAESVDDAERLVNENFCLIKQCAEDKVRELGYDYDVGVSLVREYYPTREYEGARLPAGVYLSLKVEIGRATGKNWWCVLYPPLCTSGADVEEELCEAGFSTNHIKLITNSENKSYRLRFKVVESISSFANKLRRLFR